ncbi:MAG: oligosaccharide flippase family protein [Candidatus Omnitrophota bacterium]
MKERILKNILSHSAGRIFEMVLGVLLIPFLIWKLGAKGVGLIVLAESLIRFFDLVITGLRTGLGRYIGISFAKGDKDEANSFISTAKGIFFIVFACFIAAGGLLWYYFPRFFNVPGIFTQQVGLFMFMMILSAIAQTSFLSSFAVLYSRQRFDLLNLYNAIRNTFRSLLCFGVYLFFPPKIYYYGFIYFIAIMAEQLLVYRGAGILFPERTISVKDFSFEKARKLFSFAGYRIMQSLSGLLYTDTDMVLINKFMGPYFNAVYSISLKFVSVLERLIKKSLWVLAPSYTELVGKREFSRLGGIYRSITKASALISLPICAILFLFGKDLIVLWVGKKFIASVNPMYINIMAGLPGLVFASAGGITTAFAKIRLPGIVAFLAAIGNVIISFYCAIVLGWGLVGFAFGTLCAALAYDLIFEPYYACKLSGLRYFSFISESFGKPLLLCLVFGLLIYFLKFQVQLPIIFVLTAIAICVPIYFYCAYMFIMDNNEKLKLKDLIPRGRKVL